MTINKLTRDIEAEKESSGKFWEREAQLRSKQMTLEARLEEKTKDVDRLEKLLASVKQECTATVTEKVCLYCVVLFTTRLQNITPTNCKKLLKTLQKKETKYVTSNLSFSHVFYPIENKFCHFSYH